MVLAKQRFNLRERDLASLKATSSFMQTRMSGVDFEGSFAKAQRTRSASTSRPRAAASRPTPRPRSKPCPGAARRRSSWPTAPACSA